MPELRQDPVTGAWVVVATERAKRPDTFSTEATREVASTSSASCPFCEGREQMTPPEIEADRAVGPADSPGWQLRIVPNKFPAFERTAAALAPHGALYKSMPAAGSHEVIVHSPDHGRDLAAMTVPEIVRVLRAYRRRLVANYTDGPAKSVLIIVNYGQEAGASVDHPHSQVFAAPLILPVLRREQEGSEEYYKANGSCVFCRMIEFELGARRLIVAENEGMVALAPYASQSPFTVWLMPKAHMPAFERASDDTLAATADLLGKVLKSIKTKLGDPPYNMWLHTRPAGLNTDAYHWHFEIAPKVSAQAGFELGGGMMINIVNPEAAAPFLAEAIE